MGERVRHRPNSRRIIPKALLPPRTKKVRGFFMLILRKLCYTPKLYCTFTACEENAFLVGGFLLINFAGSKPPMRAGADRKEKKMSKGVQQGKVVSFLAERKFGFIRVEGGTTDFFFHIETRRFVTRGQNGPMFTNTPRRNDDPQRIPQPGDDVVFNPATSDRGPRTGIWAFADEWGGNFQSSNGSGTVDAERGIFKGKVVSIPSKNFGFVTSPIGDVFYHINDGRFITSSLGICTFTRVKPNDSRGWIKNPLNDDWLVFRIEDAGRGPRAYPWACLEDWERAQSEAQIPT